MGKDMVDSFIIHYDANHKIFPMLFNSNFAQLVSLEAI
jgi:hypothetical protein